MNKSLAILVSISMVVVAAVVVFQVNGASLRGMFMMSSRSSVPATPSIPPATPSNLVRNTSSSIISSECPNPANPYPCTGAQSYSDTTVCCSVDDICSLSHSLMPECLHPAQPTTSACANPLNCIAGYFGTCMPSSCKQPYNTGRCIGGTSICAVIYIDCENTSSCSQSSSSSSTRTSSSSSSSTRTSSSSSTRTSSSSSTRTSSSSAWQQRRI